MKPEPAHSRRNSWKFCLVFLALAFTPLGLYLGVSGWASGVIKQQHDFSRAEILNKSSAKLSQTSQKKSRHGDAKGRKSGRSLFGFSRYLRSPVKTDSGHSYQIMSIYRRSFRSYTWANKSGLVLLQGEALRVLGALRQVQVLLLRASFP